MPAPRNELGGGRLARFVAVAGRLNDMIGPSAGVGSATVTGTGTNSFPLSVTLFFPVIAAGNDTVTCTGTLTLSDGTQVGSSPSGSVQVAAVAVDSITLADDPSTVQIGQTLARSDFTITTTPSGYDQTKNEDGSYFVTLSPSSFRVAIGDNIVTASCGVSSQSLDLVGYSVSGEWGEILQEDSATGQVQVGYSLLLNGDSSTQGTVSISGPLSPVSGDTTPTIYSGQTFEGKVWLQDPGTDFSPQDETISVDASEGGSSYSANYLVGIGGPAASTPKVAQPEDSVAKEIVGPILQQVAAQKANRTNVAILPAGVQQGLNLTLVAVAGQYNVNQCTSSVQAFGGGWGVSFLAINWWNDNPSATVNVGPPNPTSVINQGNFNIVEQFSNEALQLSVSTAGSGKNVVPDWTTAPFSTTKAGPADLLVTASSQAPGDYWNLTKSEFEGFLYQPAFQGQLGNVSDGNWQPIKNTNSDQLIVSFSWF